jgi:hypothetical protein
MVLLDCVIEENQFDILQGKAIIEEVDSPIHTHTPLKVEYLKQYFCYCYKHAFIGHVFKGNDIVLKIIIEYIIASEILC